MRSNLANVVENGHNLDEKEVRLVNSEDLPIVYVINNMLPEQRGEVYRCFVVKPESFGHFAKFQTKWMEIHRYLIGKELYEHNQDCSNEAIEGMLVGETLSGRGENIRCRIAYLAKHRENVVLLEGKDHSAVYEFLDIVGTAIEKYHRDGSLSFD